MLRVSSIYLVLTNARPGIYYCGTPLRPHSLTPTRLTTYQKTKVPPPPPYDAQTLEQARELCDRPHTSIFPRAARDDLSKLFLGKDAVAYIPSRTPGPGTYDLGRKRPSFLSPSCEPGTSIGGPLANVDRVQTGPLGAAYKSYTPGPGAYDYDSGGGEGREDETKRSPARLRQRGRYRRDFSVSVSGTRTGSSINTAVGSMVSESETTDTTRGKVLRMLQASVICRRINTGMIC